MTTPETAARLARIRAAVDARPEALGDDYELLLEEIGRLRWHVTELEARIAWRDQERERWADVHALVERAIDKGWTNIDTVDLETELGPDTTKEQ